MRNTIVRLVLCILAGMICHVSAFSQQNQPDLNEHEQCGTQQWLETQFRANPLLRLEYDRMEKKLGDAASRKLQQVQGRFSGQQALRGIMEASPVFTIPIVFHIVHTAPATITDAQIYALLDTLNKDFSGRNADSTKILPGFKPYFGKGNIQFCMAQRTPAGIGTNGIMRYTTSTISTGTSSTTDPIKSTASGGADAWDPTRYLNVWIGTFSSSGLLGYASFPITSPENPAGLLSQQGLVIEKTTIPGGSLINYNTGRVLTHEIGHYFWLRHIWGDATCGNDFPNTPTLDDTPLASGPSSGCYSGIISSGCTPASANGIMYQNYMDYTNSTCMAMFSTGQTLRMAICLDSFRASLKTSNGCQPVNCPAFTISVNSVSATSSAVNVSGGQPPYYYSLDSINFQPGNLLTGLTPGNTYTVYVRDSVFCRGKTTFTANGITITSVSSNSFCTGQTATINYTTSGAFNPGNVFTAQLSNAAGSFANPVPFASVTATGSGSITGTIHDTMPPGTHYRVRIVAGSPAVTSNSNGSDIEIANSSVTPSVSIAVTSGSNPGCLGRSISFTAIAVNGGSSPIFQWKVNGTNTDTGRTYTTGSLLNDDIVTCELTSNSSCATATAATSNAITVILSNSLLPAVTITSSAGDTICSGINVVFTATAVNGGASPIYQWRRNGTLLLATGTNQYTTNTLATGDTISCRLVSSLTCATPSSAISNGVTFFVNSSVTPSVTITSNTGASACSGIPVTFTATPVNGGTAPGYQWKKNRVNVGSNSNIYVATGLVTGDTITCVMTRNTTNVCITSTTATSNIIRMSILNCGTQLLSGNAFLKDNYVEVAVGPCGNFASSVAAPSGFHPRGGASTPNQLGFVADTGKTGWVNYVGDYFLPGTPEEGFGLTINGNSYNNNRICAVGDITGSVTNVQSGLQQSATWQGSVNGLNIKAKTYIPSGASYFVTRVTLTNTNSAPISNIYYMRNVDPDQGTITPGSSGSAYTYNSIVYQNPNSCNRALVTATARPAGLEFLGLGSIDPRAKVTKGGFENRSAFNIWNGTGLSQSGTNAYGDSAISIAFNIGTLNVNESTTFSYAYILSQSDLEKALAATGLEVNINGVAADVSTTTNICAGTSTPIRLNNTGSFTSWSWSPATGLDVTTGTSVNTTITSPITYTATGTGPCGTTTVTISLNPVTQAAVGTTGSITGPTLVSTGTLNAVYLVSPVTNATSYSWTVPPGTIFNTTADSNYINLRMSNIAVCDSVSVTARNACSISNKVVIPVCITSPYSITLAPAGSVCTAALSAYLPYTGTTGSPTSYSITWDSEALAAGFMNISNATLPASQIQITKPAGIAVGNYTGKIVVGNGIYSSPLYSFTISVISAPVLVPQVTITASTGTNICSGTPVTFTASGTNGGTTPIYQWRKNNILVSSGSGTYTTNALANNDSVTCTMTSTETCVNPATVTSNTLKFTVTTSAVPTVTITSPTGNYACTGNAVIFTATPQNAGSTPLFTWKKNSVTVGTGTSFTASGLVTNDTIVCVMTTSNACFATVNINSNTLYMIVSTVTTPIASGTATINCGQTTTLNATPTTTGNIINWYTAASGGASFARSNSVTVTPATTTTYYAEAGTLSGGIGKMVTSINTSGAVFIDHNNITGDDHGGIALSPNYVYVTGDNYTGRYNRNLTDAGTSLTLRDGFFSNLANNDLWQLGTNTSTGASFTYGTITRLYQLTEGLVPTGTYLTLSQAIDFNSSRLIAPGEGYVILYNGVAFFRISLTDGTVTNMGNAGGISFTSNESAATYAWAESDASNYFVCYVLNGQNISRKNLTTGVVTTIQTFTGLGDMATILFDPTNNRMYYHHESGSQFGGSGETLGYVGVTSSQAVPLCASNRVPVTVTVTPVSIVPSVTIVSNYPGTICSGTNVTFTASSVNGGVAPVYQWKRNGINITTGTTFTINSLVNNDVITCQLTSSVLCVTTPVANSNSITVSVVTASPAPYITITSNTSGTVCYGSNVVFTATAVNVGSSAVYQWKKNGLNIGTNSPVYVDNASTSASVYCTVYTNTPCGTTVTSSTIFITPTTPVQPSVVITSSSVNTICAGSPVAFTATSVNGGSVPQYQWKKNGVNIATGSVYTTTALANGDTILCVLTSNAFCVTQSTVTSNAIGFTVNPIPATSPVANQVVCPGSTLPAISFSGTGAQYRWTNSNTAIGLGATGTGGLPSFVATNTGTTPISGTITVTPVSDGASYAYIANTNSNTVSVVNLSTNTITATIPVGTAPFAVAASPDGTRVYVSNSGYLGGISVISTITNQVTGTIAASGSSYGLCVSPDGTRIYVTNYSTGYVYVYLAANLSTYTSYSVSSGATGVVLSPDGSKLYVASSNYLYVYNTATSSYITAIPFTGAGVTGVAVSPDGTRVYTSNSNNNTVAVINTVTNAVLNNVAVGNSPYNIAVTPDGKYAYVTNNGSNTVSVINTQANEVMATIPVGSAPAGINLNTDGSVAYVTNQNSNTVSVINTGSNTVTATISGFTGPVSWGNFLVNRQGCTGTPISFTVNVTAPYYNTWLGKVSTDWHTPANWLCDRVPAPADNVIISVSTNNYYPLIVENDTITIRSMKLENGTTVKVNTGGHLILTGN